ncbi:hypothetical protein HYH02_006489 [Chlamydomonas schloesseri]|uniref:BTB domain-containing protein n=1 Tax=Chlamydomonas schloesseri TaxID=2026947 RepID=A0A836B669_9CHLO|nr:hypothetical protein HYH02_006489 [Chlamydomonas schloesseri]|eukprot:KAG2448598.1 hypothetical protein HYH02_006489 [Chlamydomonas schloesseri]
MPVAEHQVPFANACVTAVVLLPHDEVNIHVETSHGFNLVLDAPEEHNAGYLLEGLDTDTPACGQQVPVRTTVIRDADRYPYDPLTDQVTYDPLTDLSYLWGTNIGLCSHSARTGDVAQVLTPSALEKLHGLRTVRGMVADGKGCLYVVGDWAAPAPPLPASPPAAVAGAGADAAPPPPAVPAIAAELIAAAAAVAAAAAADPDDIALYHTNGGRQAALLRVFLPGVAGRQAAAVALAALLPPEAGPAAGVALHHVTGRLYLAAEAGVYELVGGAVLERLAAGQRAPGYTELRRAEEVAMREAGEEDEAGGAANAAAAAARRPPPARLHYIRALAVTARGDLLVLHEDPERIADQEQGYVDMTRRHRGWLSRLQLGQQQERGPAAVAAPAADPRLGTLISLRSEAMYQYKMHVWRPQLCVLPHGWVAVLEPQADSRQLRLFKVGAAVAAPSVPAASTSVRSASALAARRAALAADLGALLPPGCREQLADGGSGGGGGGGSGGGGEEEGEAGGVWSAHPDVVVRVGGQDFPLHRTILAARSPVLKQLLGCVGSGASGGVVPLPGHFTAPVFAQVAAYMYTGAADSWDAETTILVTDLAHFLDLPQLRAAAQRHLLQALRPMAFAAALRWAAGWPAAVARGEGGGGAGGGFDLMEALCSWYVDHQQEVLAQAPQSLAELAQGDGGQLAVRLLQAVADAASQAAAAGGAARGAAGAGAGAAGQ